MSSTTVKIRNQKKLSLEEFLEIRVIGWLFPPSSSKTSSFHQVLGKGGANYDGLPRLIWLCCFSRNSGSIFKFWESRLGLPNFREKLKNTRDVHYLDCYKHLQWFNCHFTLNADKLQNLTILKTTYVQSLTKGLRRRKRCN